MKRRSFIAAICALVAAPWKAIAAKRKPESAFTEKDFLEFLDVASKYGLNNRQPKYVYVTEAFKKRLGVALHPFVRTYNR